MRLRKIMLVAVLILAGVLIAAFLTPTSHRGPEVTLVRLLSQIVKLRDSREFTTDWPVADIVILVSLGEPGCWKYSKTVTPRKPRVFINLFNNQWSTNFRLWNSGTWNSRVRFWAADNKRIETDLTGPSDEARFPLVAVFAEGPLGNLPPNQAGIELSRTGLRVTAFGPNPDGEGLVLRLWEEAGQDGMCDVQLPGKLRPSSVSTGWLAGAPNRRRNPCHRRPFQDSD